MLTLQFSIKKKKSVEGNFILTGFVPDQVLAVVSWPLWNTVMGQFYRHTVHTVKPSVLRKPALNLPCSEGMDIYSRSFKFAP